MKRPKRRAAGDKAVSKGTPALRRIKLTVNDEEFDLTFKSGRTLMEVLREDLDLIGTKEGCDGGECGACTVLVENEPRLACITLAATLHGKKVLTIEGLARDGKLHPLTLFESYVIALDQRQVICSETNLILGKSLSLFHSFVQSSGLNIL